MKPGFARRWVGPGIGVLLLAYLIWRMPWLEVLRTLAQVRLAWWILALGMGGFGIGLRSLRLHWVLGTQGSLFNAWRSVSLGYLAGLVLPAGGGELVKLREIMKSRGLDLLHAGAGVALDRMLDLVGLVFGLALLSGLQALPGSVGTLLRGLSIMLLFAGILLLLFLSRGEAFIARFSNSLASLPWLARRMRELGGIIEETEHLRHSRTWARLLLLQLFIVAFEVFTTGIALRSLPLTVVLPSWAGLQVLMFTAIGFALPLLPGAAGSLQVAYMVALRPWGVAIPQALAFSLLAQVGHILVVLGHGGTALLVQVETRSSGEAGLS
jgi:uncharacterized membrane protein YbhN (UPF0104 family)